MNKMTLLDALCARCSRFSGYALTWSINKKVLTIEDKENPNLSKEAQLSFMLHSPGGLQELYGSQMSLVLVSPGTLQELYERIMHWGIAHQDLTSIERILQTWSIGMAHDHYPTGPERDAPTAPKKADDTWRKEYAKYAAKYRMREGYST